VRGEQTNRLIKTEKTVDTPPPLPVCVGRAWGCGQWVCVGRGGLEPTGIKNGGGGGNGEAFEKKKEGNAVLYQNLGPREESKGTNRFLG